MRIADLIEELQQHDPTMKVGTAGPGGTVVAAESLVRVGYRGGELRIYASASVNMVALTGNWPVKDESGELDDDY